MSCPGLRLPLYSLGAYVLLAYANYISHRPPLITPALVKILRIGLRADCSKAIRELGLPQTPVEDSIRDAVVWFAKNGYVRNKKVAATIIDRALSQG